MRVVTSLLTALLVATAFASLTAAPAPSTNRSAAVMASDDSQSADAMPGCPGKLNGGACCGSCQAAAQAEPAAVAAAGEKPAGCPCQERARRLREAQARAKQP